MLTPQDLDTVLQQPILITGAGGSIGSALALRLMKLGGARLVLLESAENSLYQLERTWAESKAKTTASATFVLGDAGQHGLVEEIIATHRPGIVFHAAAHKNVPLLEGQPFAAIANNIFVTESVVAAATVHAARVVLLSTDKAVAPVSVMGATKRVAEEIVLRSGGTVLRLGNVLASSGSVVEVFAEQIAHRRPLTVTHPAALRYFLTMEEAVNLLLLAAAQPAAHQGASRVLAPLLPAMHRIVELAEFMARTLAPGREIALEFCGLRPGDKLTEQLWESSDIVIPLTSGDLAVIESAQPVSTALQNGLAALRNAVGMRDLEAALGQLRTLVPEFEPSEKVLELARKEVRRVLV